MLASRRIDCAIPVLPLREFTVRRTRFRASPPTHKLLEEHFWFVSFRTDQKIIKLLRILPRWVS